MANNLESQYPQLSEATVEKLNNLVRFAKSLRLATSNSSRIQRGSPRANALGSLIRGKALEFQQIALNTVFENDNNFPGINILRAHFSVFKDNLERRFNDGGNDPGYSERVFYLEELMYNCGMIRGHAELILEQNAYWRAKLSNTEYQPVARQLFNSPARASPSSTEHSAVSQAMPTNAFPTAFAVRTPTRIRSAPSVPTEAYPFLQILASNGNCAPTQNQATPQQLPEMSNGSAPATTSGPPPALRSQLLSQAIRLESPPTLPQGRDRQVVGTSTVQSTAGQLSTPSLSSHDNLSLLSMYTSEDEAILSAGTSSQPELEKSIPVCLDLRTHVHDCIAALWKEHKHTDVTFLVSKRKHRVSAHRAILACQSSYFTTLLFGMMLESGKEEIALSDVAQPELFVLLMEFAYTGGLEMTNRTVQDVLDVLGLADRFGFTRLKDSLSEKLSSIVTIANVLSLLVYADLYQASSLLEKCLHLIDKNAEEVLQTGDFLTLAPSTLKLIISRDTFFAPEVSIYHAVVCWKKQNTASEEELETIFGCVRLSEIPARELFVTVEPSQLFKPAEITTALRVQIKPEFQEMKPRGRKEVGKNLFELAKFTSAGNVEYSGLQLSTGLMHPPRIIDGVVEMDAPRRSISSGAGGNPQSRHDSSQAIFQSHSSGHSVQSGSRLGGTSIQPSSASGLPGRLVINSATASRSSSATGMMGLGGSSPTAPLRLGGVSVTGSAPGLVRLGSSSATGQIGFRNSSQSYIVSSSHSSRPNLPQNRVHPAYQELQIGGGLHSSGSSKTIKLSDVYLINSITIKPFSVSSTDNVMDRSVLPTLTEALGPMRQWPFSYKIRILSRESWETLFDFSGMDCFFTQTLKFPTQAVKYIEFELESCAKPLKLRFVSCSFEDDVKPFKFFEKGIIGPLYPCPLEGFLATEFPAGHIHNSDVTAIPVVLNTPHSMSQLSFKIHGPESSISGDLKIFIGQKWDFDSFKEIGSVTSSEFGTKVCVEFSKETVSYIIIHLTNIKSKKVPTEVTTVPEQTSNSPLYRVGELVCQLVSV